MLARAVADSVITWEESNGRRTPWRVAATPYSLMVAEILLQKTRGSDVVHVWQDLVLTFPYAEALVAAPEEQLREMVGSLGLGSQRVSRLKAMAADLTSGTSGRKISGIGPYGSAVAALAAGREPDTIPVDGNISRVVARFWGLAYERGEARKKPAVRQAMAGLLDTQDTPTPKLQLIYGLVDLGAMVCTPRKPNHSKCPLLNGCVFVAQSGQDHG